MKWDVSISANGEEYYSSTSELTNQENPIPGYAYLLPGYALLNGDYKNTLDRIPEGQSGYTSIQISDENGNWLENRGFTMDVSLVQNSVKLYQVATNEDGTTTKTLLSVPWTFEEWLGSNEWDSNRKCILRMSDVPDGTHLLL